MKNILRELKDSFNERRYDRLVVLLLIGVCIYLFIASLKTASVFLAFAIFFGLAYSAEIKIRLGLGRYLSYIELDRIMRKTTRKNKKLEKALEAVFKGIEGQELPQLHGLIMLIKDVLVPEKERQEDIEWNLFSNVLLKIADEISHRLIEIYKDKPVDEGVDIPEIEELFEADPSLLLDVWLQVNQEEKKLRKQAAGPGNEEGALRLQANNLHIFSRDYLRPLAILHGYDIIDEHNMVEVALTEQ